VERFNAEMRRSFTENACDRYSRELERFLGTLPAGIAADDVTAGHCRAFLDSFAARGCKPSTIALEHTILSSLFKWLALEDCIDVSPMAKVRRIKVPPLADREVVTISTEDVARMLNAAETWPERLCLGVFAFTGARRHAAAMLRWRDVDLQRGTFTLHEKGRKAIVKPIPHELRALLDAYLLTHTPTSDEWVIPNKRPLRGGGERSDRIAYNLVKDVAKRAGVTSHCHSIRAAFAVRFLEENPGRAEALQALMGHSSVATTYGYLRRYDRAEAMESVRSMSFTKPEPGEAA